MRTTLRDGASEVVLCTVILATAATSACSSDRQDNPCQRSASSVVVVMQSVDDHSTAHLVSTRGAVNIQPLSIRDTLLFEPSAGFAPFTESRSGFLSYAAEYAGSYTIKEVDSNGRGVATAKLDVSSC
jgi:hypothetical protein